MRRGKVSMVAAVLGALLVVACCANRQSGGSAGGDATGQKELVQAAVSADFQVTPDPLHLSMSAGQQAAWTLREGEGPLGIEPKERWPVKVSCDSPTSCVGSLTRDAKLGKYSYRVIIAGKPGPDPVLIIDP